VFLVALAVRLGYQASFDHAIGVDLTRLPELDQNTWHLTASRIAGGDLLLRDVYHPYHWWYRRIAPEDVFRSWYPPGAYHQSPLYAYFVAGVYGVAGAHPSSALRVQALLGAATAALTYLLGRAVFSNGIGLIAGFAMALYGPSVFYESNLLREGLLAFLATALVLALQRAGRANGSRGAWLASGLLFGFAVLGKPSFLLYLPVGVGYLVWQGRSLDRRTLASRAAALALGLVLAFVPLVARNGAVGASPLALTTRGPYEFLNGNASASNGCGWFPPETRAKLLGIQAREILNRTEARMLPTVRETLATHRDAPLGFLALLAHKAGAFFSAYEYPNNVDYHVVRGVIPLLRLLPSFWLVGPFAILGLAFAWRRREVRTLLLFAAAYYVATVLFFILARFRVPVVPVLMIFAAFAAVQVGGWVRARRWRRALAAVGALALLAFLIRPGREVPSNAMAAVRVGDLHAALGDRERAEARYRWAEDPAHGGSPLDRLEALTRLGRLGMRSGRSMEVATRLREFLREDLTPEVRAIAHIELGTYLDRIGRTQDAVAEYEAAIRMDPSNPFAYYLLAQHEQAEGSLEGAIRIARRCVEVASEFAGGYVLLGELLLESGDADGGREALERAFAIGFEDPELEDRARSLLGGAGEGD